MSKTVLLLWILWLLTGGINPAAAQPNQPHKAVNPIAETWRQVREGTAAYSAVQGQEANELIQASGQNWRRLRNGPMARLGAWLLAGTLAALGLFYIVRGKVPLDQPRTGRTVLRWTGAERLMHWMTALLFLILALTGLSLMYGRALLIPVLGHASFAAYAELCKGLHNLLGPLFLAGLFILLITWLRDNIPNRSDIAWFKAYGGIIGRQHPSAGRMNGGEKLWFWLLATAGLMMGISGLVLDFPNFGQDRWIMQTAHLLHVGLAFLIMAAALAHIYIGSIGEEGALEGMITGRVDERWARQHHDLWLQAVDDADPELGRGTLAEPGKEGGSRVPTVDS